MDEIGYGAPLHFAPHRFDDFCLQIFIEHWGLQLGPELPLHWGELLHESFHSVGVARKVIGQKRTKERRANPGPSVTCRYRPGSPRRCSSRWIASRNTADWMRFATCPFTSLLRRIGDLPSAA